MNTKIFVKHVVLLKKIKIANFEELGLLAGIAILEEVELRNNEPQRTFRRREDPFVLSDRQFIRLFRLSKDLVRELTEMIQPFMVQASRRSALDVQTKVLIALRFYASGSYQLDTGCNYYFGVSQSSVSRCIREVTDALNQREILERWVRFPQRLNELESLRRQFYELYGFPGVVGCIDCTHVAIFPPCKDDPAYPEHIYVNRKHYHSINVQLVCDWKLKILNVNARYAGSTHDAYIWRNSVVQNAMKTIHRRYTGAFYLLGDSGYPLRPWLLTPLEQDPQPGSPEEMFNNCQRSTRSLIERCNGVLKSRFRCLLKHRVLHYAPNVASRIVNACVILHNMCIENNIPEPEPGEDNEEDFGILRINNNIHNRVAGRIVPELAEARRLQQHIINNYFR